MSNDLRVALVDDYLNGFDPHKTGLGWLGGKGAEYL